MGRLMSPEERTELKLTLKRLRERKPKIPLRVVGAACGGKTPQAVAAWEDPSKPNLPSLHDAAILAGLYNVKLTELIKNPDDLSEEGSEEIATAGRLVPSVNWEDVAKHQAGDTSIYTGRIRTHFASGPRAFQVCVQNNENYPDLAKGDSLIIDPDAVPSPGNYCLAWHGQRLAIGRWRPRGAKIEVAPRNAEWDTFEVTPDKIVGIVTEHSRERPVSE